MIISHDMRRIGSRQDSTRSRWATSRAVPLTEPATVPPPVACAGADPSVMDGTVVRLVRSAPAHHHHSNPARTAASATATTTRPQLRSASWAGSCANPPGGSQPSTPAEALAPLAKAPAPFADLSR